MTKKIRAHLVMFSLSLLAACGPVDHPETTFTLENGTDQKLYVQDYEWFRLIADGEMVSSTDTLCLPRCGDLFGGQVACAARLATVVELEPGESVERTWDGVYYEVDEARECYHERGRGKDLEVEYCWGEDFNRDGLLDDDDGTDGVYEGGWIEDPTCEREAFERGEDVQLVID